MHYTQQIADAATGGALHFETGMWLDVPATTAPAAPETVTRLATIPHGDALLAQGEPLTVQGGPRIDPVASTPIRTSTGKPVTDEKYLAPFKHTALPVGNPAEAVVNPNVVLTDAIKGQKITETIVLPLSTTEAIGGTAGGIPEHPVRGGERQRHQHDGRVLDREGAGPGAGPVPPAPVHADDHPALPRHRLAAHQRRDADQAVRRAA
ncbi:hypothetical protein AB0F91_02150 [Amycolatopsis sp. NPDC023774]|uniref:hypothetical protein n=1 Tax=Amycolatopsis sp. NPDC023774 TaxID=3155015 RepID=UPI00340E8881